MPDVISANRLSDGAVVFYDSHGGWARTLAEAEVYLTRAEADMALAQAKGDEMRNLVVDAYAFAVKTDHDGPLAVTLRDRIRATGPTIDYAPS